MGFMSFILYSSTSNIFIVFECIVCNVDVVVLARLLAFHIAVPTIVLIPSNMSNIKFML